ncbi:O-antigen ligase family protein [Rhodococcus sp. 27YEA15]|uniref:O-antigen ligase family protein n=1 Tax=Rhodococcus sp. 27YEA15 TaxID=3156259 RepID=UPI003C7C9899
MRTSLPGSSAPTRTTSTALRVGVAVGLSASLAGVPLPGLPSAVNAALPLALLACVFACTGVPRGHLARLRLGTIDVGLVLYICAVVLIEFYDVSYGPASFSLYTVLNWITVLAAYTACRLAVVDYHDATVVLRCFFFASIPVALLGIAQVVGGRAVSETIVRFTIAPGLQTRLDLGWPLRATSTLGHWTALGGYLAIAISIGCYLVIRQSRTGAVPAGVILGVGVLFLAQTATFTFAPILVALVVMVYTAVVMRVRPLGIFAAIGLGAIAYRLFDDQVADRLNSQLDNPNSNDGLPYWIPETIRFRTAIWRDETVPAIMDSPLLGHGSNVYNRISNGQVPPELRWPSPESEWMRTAMAGGIPIAIMECGLLVLATVAIWTVSVERSLPEYRPLAICMIGMLLVSSFHSHFSSGSVALAFWVIVAGSVNSMQFSHQRTDEHVNRKV